jgi:2-polyprenyl-3-methyl-5-hydroxy-6-metoxy-1,4-benzoquinol methylase
MRQENPSDLYAHYTSTCSLAEMDQEATLKWSSSYFRRHYAKLLPRDKSRAILDLGCGCGIYLRTLKEMGYENCWGIDISAEQVSYAKHKLDVQNIECASALEWLKEKEGCFDAILVLDVLEHLQLQDLLELGNSICKALKPGGEIIVQVPNGMSPVNPFLYGDLTHVRAFTIQSLQQFFLNVGCELKGYFEVPPYVHDVKTFFRRLLWSVVVRPAISVLVTIVHGRVVGGNMYTANLIAVARKSNNVEF